MQLTGFDLFEVDVPTEAEAAASFFSEGLGAFLGAQRGDTFKVGKSRYEIFYVESPHAAHCYRVGTRGAKAYCWRHEGASGLLSMRQTAGSHGTSSAKWTDAVLEQAPWLDVAKQIREKFLSDEERDLAQSMERLGNDKLALDIRSLAWAERGVR